MQLGYWLRVKNLPATQKVRQAQAQSLSWEDPLEKGMAIHSNVLGWRIPWTEEPGGLQSMGLQRVRHSWVTDHTDTHTTRLQASACSQWRHLAQIWGWSLGHLASKGPKWMDTCTCSVGGSVVLAGPIQFNLNWTKLTLSSWKTSQQTTFYIGYTLFRGHANLKQPWLVEPGQMDLPLITHSFIRKLESTRMWGCF